MMTYEEDGHEIVSEIKARIALNFQPVRAEKFHDIEI
jgi:hypothetical protein